MLSNFIEGKYQRQVSGDKESQRKVGGIQSLEKNLNLLLLGETGVGKSTLINAMTNYDLHDTFYEAKSQNKWTKQPVPSTFSLENDSGELEIIQVGQQPKRQRQSEEIVVGHSQTQVCKTYSFTVQQQKLTFIDTPGFNDTRAGKDEEHLEYTIKFLERFNQPIHGIWVLLRPDEKNLSQNFKGVFYKLLNIITKEGLENIQYIFTNAISTFFEGGQTIDLIRTFSKQLPQNSGAKIPVDHQKMFYFDSNAFRYLMVSKKQSFKYLKDQKYQDHFNLSWTKSREQFQQLLQQVYKQKPLRSQSIVILYQTKRYLKLLASRMIEVQKSHQLQYLPLYLRAKKFQQEKIFFLLQACIQEIQNIFSKMQQTGNLASIYINQQCVLCCNKYLQQQIDIQVQNQSIDISFQETIFEHDINSPKGDQAVSSYQIPVQKHRQELCKQIFDYFEPIIQSNNGYLDILNFNFQELIDKKFQFNSLNQKVAQLENQKEQRLNISRQSNLQLSKCKAYGFGQGNVQNFVIIGQISKSTNQDSLQSTQETEQTNTFSQGQGFAKINQIVKQGMDDQDKDQVIQLYDSEKSTIQIQQEEDAKHRYYEKQQSSKLNLISQIQKCIEQQQQLRQSLQNQNSKCHEKLLNEINLQSIKDEQRYQQDRLQGFQNYYNQQARKDRDVFTQIVNAIKDTIQNN